MAEPAGFLAYSVLVTGSDRGIGLGLVKRFLELPSPPKWVATTLDLRRRNPRAERIGLQTSESGGVAISIQAPRKKWSSILEKVADHPVQQRWCLDLQQSAIRKCEGYDRRYSVNTIGPLLMSQAFLPLLKKAARRSPGQGLSSSKAAIINVSSIGGSIELMAVWDRVQIIGYRCSKAEISVEESTQGILIVLSKLCEEDNGTFLDYLGQRLGSRSCSSWRDRKINGFLRFQHPGDWIRSRDRSGSGEEVSGTSLSTQKLQLLEMAKSMDFCVFSVLVTGSDRGIGLGLVKRFLELPYPPKWVFATTLDLEGKETEELRELACKHSNLVVLQLDVTKLESIQAAQKEVQKCVGEGGLTILYNNAGIWTVSDLQTENAKDMMSVYAVNTIGPLQMSQLLSLEMTATSFFFFSLQGIPTPAEEGSRRSPCQGLSSSKAAIINMSSIAGSIELMAVWDQYQIIGYRCSKVPSEFFMWTCLQVLGPPFSSMRASVHASVSLLNMHINPLLRCKPVWCPTSGSAMMLYCSHLCSSASSFPNFDAEVLYESTLFHF
ncbi:hypothetical protein E2320_023041 [Naja naja]|nr:hypothetical protein E2320_023041 [Naja naja]